MPRHSNLAMPIAFAAAFLLTGMSGGTAKAATNELQRSFEVYNYNVAGTSGAQRGEAIYYFKCWVCHNDFTIAAGSPAPSSAS